MTTLRKTIIHVWKLLPTVVFLPACSPSTDNAVVVEGNFPVAYVERTANTAGNPTDGLTTSGNGDLYIRELASPSASEQNITFDFTHDVDGSWTGDVSDPEVSFDATKLLFAMRCSATASVAKDARCTGTWDIWQYEIASGEFNRLITDNNLARQGPDGLPAHDVDPAYLPNGNIVFSSNRQQKSADPANAAITQPGYRYLDEYEREQVIVLHTLDRQTQKIQQISFNQSHDRNPFVLSTGDVVYSRWDHVGGRNQFSIFKTKPDGTSMFIHYGAHSGVTSFLHPREMEDGRIISDAMPLSRTAEGGALLLIDAKNCSENRDCAAGIVQGQSQPTLASIPTGRGLSSAGRYTTPYPIWDGTNSRVLVSWTPCRVRIVDPLNANNFRIAACADIDRVIAEMGISFATPEERTAFIEALADNPEAAYGVSMFNLNTRTLLAIRNPRFNDAGEAVTIVTDPVAIIPRQPPATAEPTGINRDLMNRNKAIINVKSVYDTDSRERMGASVLTVAESADPDLLPANGAGEPDIGRIKDPAQTAYNKRPARFVRITKSVPTPTGMGGMREIIGETDMEMQQIVGYTVVQPDGSFQLEVPADVPVTIAVLDAEGRAFQTHTNWIQARPGETRSCNGCHSPRRGDPLVITQNTVGNHPNTVLDGIGGPNNTMAEVMASEPAFSSILNLLPDIEYVDALASNPMHQTPCISIRYDGNVDCNTGMPQSGENLSTPVPLAGIINYPEHIQPIWDNKCVTCHSPGGNASAVAMLDLSNVISGSGRLLSYQELLVGDPKLDENGQIILQINEDGELEVVRDPPLVVSGGVNTNARGSHLTEILYGQELLATGDPDDPQDLSDITVDHTGFLNAAERRVVVEWMDVGAQYYNSPYDNAGQPRGVTGLDEGIFASSVHGILMNRCAGCHQAFGTTDPGLPPDLNNPIQIVGNRFVLTGNLDGDFNATASMVNNACSPDASYLLSRPSSPTGAPPDPVHPLIDPNNTGTSVPVLPSTDPDYTIIRDWILTAC